MDAPASQTINTASGSASGMARSRMLTQSTSASGTTNSRSSSQDTSTASSDWHLHFKIPDASTFSGCVQEAINTGVVTAKARREINLILRTYTVAHTIYPTSEQYNTVCRKLITKFPNLRDDEIGKSPHVSFSN